MTAEGKSRGKNRALETTSTFLKKYSIVKNMK